MKHSCADGQGQRERPNDKAMTSAKATQTATRTLSGTRLPSRRD